MGREAESKRERYWRGLMERRGKTGESVRAICLEEGVSECSFYRWRRRLDEEAREAAGFVAVDVVEKEGASGGSGVELGLPCGVAIRVSPGFDGETLRRVLAELEGRGC